MLLTSLHDTLRYSSPRSQTLLDLFPSIACTNANSSFFGSKAFCLILSFPTLGGFRVDRCVGRPTAHLSHRDGERSWIFFVKTAKRTSTNAAYDQNTFTKSGAQ
jgi:hypothetical protein